MTESSQSAVRKKKERGSVTAIYDIRYEHIPLIKAIYIHTIHILLLSIYAIKI